jgi:hypothetical protein
MYSINIWAIIVATVVSFGIGALWYSPVLFGKEWMSLMKIREADIANVRAQGGMWKSYLIHLVATLVSFIVLAFIVSATQIWNGSDGAFFGFLVWLGFVMPLHVSRLLWQKDPFKLVLIDTVQVLLSLVIGGAIIGAWR